MEFSKKNPDIESWEIRKVFDGNQRIEFDIRLYLPWFAEMVPALLLHPRHGGGMVRPARLHRRSHHGHYLARQFVKLDVPEHIKDLLF